MGTAGERRERIGEIGRFIAEHQMPRRLPRHQRLDERNRCRNFRQRKNATLLGGLDGIGAHAFEIDPRDLAVTGKHRLQLRGAHLDCFLHHVIEPRRLERRE